ncbi:MAG: peptidylprolyl isomerase [Myxococcota bacterium]|nr:peptidylprolyl isomerase [Myxococcota bacterium]
MTLSIVEKDVVASVHYRGTLTDTGEEFDSSRGGEPLSYLVGAGQMIPGFEKALMGAAVGDKKTFNLEAEEAYGPKDPEGVQQVPRDQFPAEVEVGMIFGAEMPDGNSIPIRVVEANDEFITVDFNHQLAGQRLTFEVEVMNVRAASDEEKEHGHAH